MPRIKDGDIPVREFGKRTKPMGFRCNLTLLEEDIAHVQKDYNAMVSAGQAAEAFYLLKELNRLNQVRNRAIKYGTGYYDYRVVNNTGRNLVLAVAIVLAFVLFVGYLVVVF